VKKNSRESGATAVVHKGLMSQVEQMAEFVNGARFDALGTDIRQQIKIRILDALGCGLGALGGEPMRMIRGYINELGGTGSCTLIGGGSTDLDRAALYNSALISSCPVSPASRSCGTMQRHPR
jgi:2-methylcitrate dehydratase PrpD